MKTTSLVAAWLAAVATANAIVSRIGPEWSVVTAFALIGPTLTIRDALHDAWTGSGLRWRMASLIASGGALSWIAQPATGMIVVGSVVAFVAAESVDALVYHRTGSTDASNAAGAVVDSVLFPCIAFGAIMPLVIVGQFAAKTIGGAAWKAAMRRRK